MLASSEFWDKGHVPLLGILNVVLWVFIVIRVRTISQSNKEYPSRWRTASAISIIFAGTLSTTYFGCWIGNLILNERLYAIGQRYHIPDDYMGGGPLNITPATFTTAEMDTMIHYVAVLGPLIDSSRTIITVALWCTKFSFVTSLLANAFCLPKGLRWALYTTTGVIVASLGVAIWAVSWVMTDGFPPYTPEDIVDTQMWLGSNYIFTDAMLETIPTGLNIATDIIVTAIACFIVRTTRVSTGATSLLISMLAVTLVTAISRLIVIVEFFKLMDIISPENETAAYYNIVESNKLTVVAIVMSELEVVLSAIVSCLPWLRAWMRGLRKDSTSAVTFGENFNSSSEKSPGLTVSGHYRAAEDA